MDNRKIFHVTQIAVIVAVMAILSYVRIPMPSGVPIVLENLGVMLAALLLGAKRGTIAVVIFIVLRLLGIGGPGGLIVLTGQASGYVYGWLLMPVVIVGLIRAFHVSGWIGTFIAVLIAGILLDDFVFGTVGLIIAMHMPLIGALTANFSFVIGDVVKALIAAVVGSQLMKSTHFRNLVK